MQLVAAGTSTAGYVTIAAIMGLENVLDQVEDFAVDWGRERGRDPALYYLRVVGEPGPSGVWGWRFGGHHISLNVIVVESVVRSTTPCFLARAILLDRAPSDIIGGNRSRIAHGDEMILLPDIWRGHFTEERLHDRVYTMSRTAEQASGLDSADHRRLALTDEPKGLPATALDTGQREILHSLLGAYRGRVWARRARHAPSRATTFEGRCPAARVCASLRLVLRGHNAGHGAALQADQRADLAGARNYCAPHATCGYSWIRPSSGLRGMGRVDLAPSAGMGDSVAVNAPDVSASLRSWMSAVSEITRAVNAAEPLDTLLGRVAEQACVLIGFEYCAVMLADADGEQLVVAGWSGLTSDYVAMVSDSGSLVVDPPGPEQDTPAARAYREGRTVTVPDVRGTRRYGRLRALAAAQGYRALLAAPLRTCAERAGVVVGYSVAAREFGSTERELVELLADQAALALETARLRSGQQTVIAELSRANKELRRRRAMLEWAEQQHRGLMELVLAEVGLAGIVASLADSLGASVTVEDAEGRLLARAPERGYRPPPDAVARRRRTTRTALEAQARSYEVIRVPARMAGRPGAAAVGHPARPGPAAWVAPVVLGGELAGRLWVVDPPSTPEPIERRVIERFALVVGLELLKLRHVADVETRLSGDLVGDLLRSDGPDHLPGVVERAAALGHDLHRRHIIAVLATDPPSGVTRWMELVRAVLEPDVRVLVGRHDDVWVMLLPADPDPTPLLRRVLSHLEQAAGERATITLVAGPAAGSPGEYSAAYRVAAGAACLRQASRRSGFVDVRNLGLSALLLETGTPEALQRFAGRMLGAVEAHDDRRGGDLVATLRLWLSVGCSASKAAVALVVHPNTISYRLARIEQLTGRSLRQPETRLELQLALTVRDVVQLGQPAPSAKQITGGRPSRLDL